MSRACKKIVGLAGLAFVIGITAVASGMPPAKEVSAASDVNVQFKITDEQYFAEILQPSEGSILFVGEKATAKINYHLAESITVQLITPLGEVALNEAYNPTDDAGRFEVALPLKEFGRYILRVSGTDSLSNSMPSNSINFEYKGISIIPPATGEGDYEDDDSNYSEIISVGYGAGICKIGIEAYDKTDTEKQRPLIDGVEHIIGVPKVTDESGKIDISRSDLGLGTDEYRIVVNAYDCISDEPVDSDEFVIPGMVEPPKTGGINIFGTTIDRLDYLIVGLIVFGTAVIAAFFLLRRHKKISNRR